MNVIREFLESWPFLWLLFEMLCILLPLAGLLVYCGIGFLSVFAKILSLVRKRASFDKCARQLALFGFVLGWLILIGARIWLFLARMHGDHPPIFTLMMEICWFALAFSVLATSLYYALWKNTVRHPVIAVVLGMCGGISACLALFTTLTAIRVFALGLPGSTTNANLREAIAVLAKVFVKPENSPSLWNMLWYTPPLLVALAAGCGALWLFLRRRHDDFGRDHYNTMIAWCARLSRNAWGLVWGLLLVFSLYHLNLTTENTDDAWLKIATEAAYLLYWVIPALLWTLVSRSAVALRHQITLWAALLLAGSFMVPYYLEVCAG